MKPASLSPALAGEVRAQLARIGLSQADLAERSTLSTATLSRKLSGRHTFTLLEVELIADSLGIRASELLRRAEEQLVGGAA